MVPVIETARLRLRCLTKEDLRYWVAATSDPEVVRYLGGVAFSREDIWRRILATAGSWHILGYGYWAVELRDRPEMIGHVGFGDFKRDMQPGIEGMPEMGWVFARAGQGRGYASEAVAAGLDWADQALAGQEIAAIIDPDNAPSIRVAEKAGFSSCEQAVYRDQPILLFKRPAASPAAAG
jgi:RimJ/RimL family protein N-acetyltransferase